MFGFLRYVVAVGVAMVAFVLSVGYYLSVLRPQWNKEPVLTTAEQIVLERNIVDDANFNWIVYAAADDMLDPSDRLAAAVTIENIAYDRAAVVEREEDGKKIIERHINPRTIVYSFESLAAPGQRFVSFRTLETMQSNVPKEAIAQTATLYREYRDNPAPWNAKMPWLKSSRRYIRTRFFKILGVPVPPLQHLEGIRKEMCILHGEVGRAQYFRFKKDPEEKC